MRSINYIIQPFVVVTEKKGCSYERKARNCMKVNASALVVINDEVTKITSQ